MPGSDQGAGADDTPTVVVTKPQSAHVVLPLGHSQSPSLLQHSPTAEEAPQIQDESLVGPHAERRQHESESQQSSKMDMIQQQQQLPFFQRYFTKPVPTIGDAEKQDHHDRQFSFLSVGSLVVEVLLLLLVAAVIGAAVATSIEHHEAKARQQSASVPVRLAILSNFPDPALLYDNGTWYAFATNNAAGVLPYMGKGGPSNAPLNTPDFGLVNIQMASSTNFYNWTVAPAADQPLPNTGEWTQANINGTYKQAPISSTWAPAVIRTDEGKYVMYYTSPRGATNPYTEANGFAVTHPPPHCIGVAVSNTDTPAGLYTPINEQWVCPWEEGGAIDPEVIRDADGTLYLVYKVDGNNIGSGGECGNTVAPIQSTPIMLQQLSANGTELIGDPVQILTNDGPGDGPLVEAPMLIRTNEGIYFLFFSSGCTRTPTYDTKYATATNISGPFTRSDTPLLKTGLWDLEAPGSIGISEDGESGWNMAFHARVNDGDIGRVRAMFTTKLNFTGHEVEIVSGHSAVQLQ